MIDYTALFDALMGVVTQSPFLAVGVVLLVLAVGLSVLSGLLDIAFYVAIIGGLLLLVVGVADVMGVLSIPVMDLTSALVTWGYAPVPGV